MDTKLTKNKIYKEINIFLVILSIIIFSISLTKTITEYRNTKYIHKTNFYDEYNIRSYIDSFDETLKTYLYAYEDMEGTIRQDIYKAEKERDKKEKENLLKESENNIRSMGKSQGLTEDEINENVERAKENILSEDNDIDAYFYNIKINIFETIARTKNIEFYIEDNTGAKITNIKDNSFEYKIKNKEFEDENYYYMYFPNSKNDNENNLYSKELSKVYPDLIDYYNRETVKYYRIPKNLNEGDNLYYEWDYRKGALNTLKRYSIISLVSGIITLILAILSYKYKNKNKDENGFMERLYLKLPLDIKIFIPILCVNTIKELITNVIPYYSGNSYSNKIIALSIVAIIVTYLLIKDMILIIGGKRALGNILTKKYIIIVIDKLKNCYIVSTTAFKVSAMIFMTALAIWCTILINYYSYWNYITVMTAQIYVIVYLIILTAYVIIVFGEANILNIKSRKIADGKYEKEYKKNRMIIFKEIESNMLNIEEGLNGALDKAIKSERMKSELITNVSHDLKTPLTSIINYVDLLKEENLSQEKRDKYIEVLDIKSKRLKILIEDLFEASKVTSGSIEFEKEELNIVSLLRQILGELEEKISLAELNVITKWSETKAILFLDGRKTFRAFENLVNNIIKYSMRNSRVYIEVISNDEEVIVIMKNISSYQLDFTAEEIVERFKRGDKSRSTEGSGLGLAIAKSIVELQGGSFEIDIDGDLFKVTIKFKK